MFFKFRHEYIKNYAYVSQYSEPARSFDKYLQPASSVLCFNLPDEKNNEKKGPARSQKFMDPPISSSHLKGLSPWRSEGATHT